MKFFKTLNERNEFGNYAQALDWLLSDNKFNKNVWDNKNKVRAFTNSIHKLEHFTMDRLCYKAKKDIKFPEKGSYTQFEVPTIFMSKGESEARDFVRHLRNGIAHGNLEIIDRNNEMVVELLDYGKEGDEKSGQTAYFVIPLKYLLSVYNLYIQKENQWLKGRRRN